jgi:hypothetical protein
MRLNVIEVLEIEPGFFKVGDDSPVGLPLGVVDLFDDNLLTKLFKDLGDLTKGLPSDDNHHFFTYSITIKSLE